MFKGQFYYDTQNYEKSLSYFQEIINKVFICNSMAHFRLGLCYFQLKDYSNYVKYLFKGYALNRFIPCIEREIKIWHEKVGYATGSKKRFRTKKSGKNGKEKNLLLASLGLTDDLGGSSE